LGNVLLYIDGNPLFEPAPVPQHHAGI
jgi:hypothetical protein